MNCKEKGCEGEINKNNPDAFPVGRHRASIITVYPCEECGRLHDRNGSLVFDNAGNRPFLEYNEIILRDKNDKIVKF